MIRGKMMSDFRTEVIYNFNLHPYYTSFKKESK